MTRAAICLGTLAARILLIAIVLIYRRPVVWKLHFNSFILRYEAAMLFFSFYLFFLLCLTRWVEAAEYQEKLSLKPLPNSALLAAFNFRSNTSISAFDNQNFRFFPRSLGQILQHAHTKELHLRFSLGRWDAQTWGARPRGGRREGGTGVELWAWIEADTDEEYVSSY